MARFVFLMSFFCFSAVMGLCFTGCMVGPGFHRPAATVSKSWTEAGDTRVKAGFADERSWWKVFGDPVLDGLIDRAYRENLSLRVAGVRVLEARAQLGIATGEFYPQTQQAVGSLQYNRGSEHAVVSLPPFHYSQSQIGLNAF